MIGDNSWMKQSMGENSVTLQHHPCPGPQHQTRPRQDLVSLAMTCPVARQMKTLPNSPLLSQIYVDSLPACLLTKTRNSLGSNPQSIGRSGERALFQKDRQSSAYRRL